MCAGSSWPPAVVCRLRHLDGVEALAAASIDWPEARIDVDLAAISDELGLDARGSDVASCPCDNSSSHPPAIRRMLLAVALRFPLMAASIWSFMYFMLWSPVLGGVGLLYLRSLIKPLFPVNPIDIRFILNYFRYFFDIRASPRSRCAWRRPEAGS